MAANGFEQHKQDVIKVYREYEKYRRATGATASAHRETILRLLWRVTGAPTIQRALMIARSYDRIEKRKKEPAPKARVQIKLVYPDAKPKPKRKSKGKGRKSSRGGSVWTVSGGLPGLGKR